MKAISLLQPWASLWLAGIKKNETRSWWTSHVGVVAIHASKARNKQGAKLWQQLLEPPRDTPDEDNPDARAFHFARFDVLAANLPLEFSDLPFGAIIGVTEITSHHRTIDLLPEITDTIEYHLGDYSPNRFAWGTNRARRITFPQPIPCRGSLGLWNVPDDIYKQFAPWLSVKPSVSSGIV